GCGYTGAPALVGCSSECNCLITPEPQPNRKPAIPQRRDERRVCLSDIFSAVLRASAVEHAFLRKSSELGTISRDTDRLRIYATPIVRFMAIRTQLVSLEILLSFWVLIGAKILKADSTWV